MAFQEFWKFRDQFPERRFDIRLDDTVHYTGYQVSVLDDFSDDIANLQSAINNSIRKPGIIGGQVGIFGGIELPTTYNWSNLRITTPEVIVEYESSGYHVTLKNLDGEPKMIYSQAFEGCRNMLSIRFPDELYRIGQSAFSGCMNLSMFYHSSLQVKVPGRLTFPRSRYGLEIKNEAFQNCRKIKSVIFLPQTFDNPNPNGKSRLTLGLGCFERCTMLVRVRLPVGLTTIPEGAFKECNITDLQLPRTLKTIEFQAFANGAGGDIVFPDSLEVIGTNAFEDSAVTDISIPPNLREIGLDAFSGCVLLKRILFRSFASSPRLEIKYRAFAGCIALRELYFPDHVWKIYSEAFADCDNLEAVSISMATEYNMSTSFPVDADIKRRGICGDDNMCTIMLVEPLRF